MIWMPDGEIVNRPGYTPARSDIASFWLKGPAAGYQDWKSLVLEYIRAEKAYADTGDEGPLRKTVTTDQALYYISKARLSERKPEDLKDKAEFWGSVPERATVPEGVRFLIATVDVQAKSFVVQVHGFMPTGDIVVVDSFRLTMSNRINENGERLMMEPPIYSEDWDLLETEILHRSYELADESGRRMRIRVTACDSGGREGTTAQAYDFWRRLRAKPEALHRRFILVKGDGQQRGVSKRPRAATTWPDSAQKDKFTASRGDVPVVMLNSNLLKDQLAGMLARRVGHTVFENTEGTEVAEGRVGLGMIRYPNWMPDWFYKQMTNEVRTEKGWENPASRRNEVWDLLYYAIGVAIRPNEKGVPLVNINFDRLNFEDPPAWAAEWDHNDMVFGRTSEKAEARKASNPLDRLGKVLG
jgi:phage terminase large subunit GpA-like protein